MGEKGTPLLFSRGYLSMSRNTWLSHVGNATGISWIEARDTSKHPTKHRTDTKKNNWPKMSAVPRLRNADRD